MSIASAQITVSGIDIAVVRKKIKNLHIGVYPPLGRVRVAAPDRLSDDQVRLAVIQRIPWIRRQQQQLQTADRQSLREMISGESHYVWGDRLRLKVIERSGSPHVERDSDRLMLFVPDSTSAAGRRRVLELWLRGQLKEAVPDLVDRWVSVVGVETPEVRIRRMKTKWGSCIGESNRVWINVELAKKHPGCLEYVMVHEMVHFKERLHGSQFMKLMDQHLPDWRARLDDLNRYPLDHQSWPDADEVSVC